MADRVIMKGEWFAYFTWCRFRYRKWDGNGHGFSAQYYWVTNRRYV